MATEPVSTPPADFPTTTTPAALKELSDLVGERQARLLLSGLVARLRHAPIDAEVATVFRKTRDGFRAEFKSTERAW